MPVITFPTGPRTAPDTEEPELQEGEVESAFWECGCGSTAFYMWDDGEAQCVECDAVLREVMIVDISRRLDEIPPNAA